MPPHFNPNQTFAIFSYTACVGGCVNGNNPIYDVMIKEAEQLAEEKAYVHAEALCKNILLCYPDDIEALIMLGSVCFDVGKTDEALEVFRQLLMFDSQDAYPHAMIGLCCMTLGSMREDTMYEETALGHFEKAMALEPMIASGPASYDIALAYMYTHRLEKAVEYFEKYLESSYGSDISVYDHLGASYAELEKPDTAERFMLLALSLEESAVRYYSLGQLYASTKRYDMAVDAYRKAIALDDKHVEAFCNLSDAYLNLQQYDKALEAGLKALALKPNDPIALTNVAESYEGLGDGCLARVYYEMVLNTPAPLCKKSNFV